MSYKRAIDGTALTAEFGNDNYMDQVVSTFTNAAQRDNLLVTPKLGQHVYLESTNQTLRYEGTAAGWVEIPSSKLGALTQRQTVVCTSTTRPAHAAGRFIYETDTKTSSVSDGLNWIGVAGMANAYLYAANQVLGWGAGWKHLPLNAESFDTHNGHVTGAISGEDTNTGTAITNRYTVQPGQAGRYRVGGGLVMTVSQAAGINVRVVKNGVEFPGCAGVQSNSSVSGAVVTGDKLVDLIVGDWVGIQGYCSVANWNTVIYSDAACWMTVQRIS